LPIRLWRSRQDRWRSWTLTHIRQGAICAEIGVWKGDFSAQILRAEKSIELHLIDPWAFDPRFPQRWYGGAIARNQADMDKVHDSVVSRFRKFSNVKIKRLHSLEAASLYAVGSLDWVYIDGDHSASAVEKDIRAWFSKIRPGGVLVGDDYDWSDESGARSVQAGVESACRALNVVPERIEGGQYLIRARA
jgi:hypothetical protein